MIDVKVFRGLVEAIQQIGLHLTQDEVDQIVLVIRSACTRLLNDIGEEEDGK